MTRHDHPTLTFSDAYSHRDFTGQILTSREEAS